MKTHGEAGYMYASSHEIGATSRRILTGDETMACSM